MWEETPSLKNPTVPVQTDCFVLLGLGGVVTLITANNLNFFNW